MTVTVQSFYEVLGVPPDADTAAIRRAYLAEARTHHPDRHAGDAAALARAEDRMRRINEAWMVLGDPGRRAAHDRDLRRDVAFGSATTVAPRRGPGTRTTPEASSGTAPPRWLTMLPPLLLFCAMVCFSVGMVVGLTGVLVLGLALAVLGGVSFVLAPVAAMHRSRR